MRHAGQRQEEMAIPAEDEDITCVMWEVGGGVLPHSLPKTILYTQELNGNAVMPTRRVTDI